MEVATRFAKENRVTLLLKGAGTVITDGNTVYVNSTGSSALAKAGSGDVLAGVVSSLSAAGVAPIQSAALAAYLHGAASDTLSLSLSEFGVTPSDLPVAVAREFANLT
jgi:NAD(P)H-hydrate epimerase